MATVVEDIFDAITTTTGSTLGTDWIKLRRVFAPEVLDLRTAEQAYGVKHLAASSADGVTKFYTLDHGFEVILSRTFADRLDDTDIQDTINDLYDKADDLLVEFFLNKLGLPATVLVIDQPSLGEPEVLDNQVVILRVGFNVKYRNRIV
jgi:hypothetical protein